MIHTKSNHLYSTSHLDLYPRVSYYVYDHMHINIRIATYEKLSCYLFFVVPQSIMPHGDNFPRHHAMFSHNRINEMEPINLLKISDTAHKNSLEIQTYYS